MNKDFDIFKKLKENIEDFEDNSITLAKGKNENGAKYLGKDARGYVFSQRDTVNKIDLAMASTYESGIKDSEGQRKLYLNIVRFVRDVSRMRTDVDVKNYVFKPECADYQWEAFFMQRKFHVYAREKNWGETLNRLGDDFCTYGVCVTRRVGKEIKRVPIRSLRNSQGAESLKVAASSGGYVIEENKMTKSQMEKMRDWKLDGIEYDKEYCVYLQHSLVPRGVINRINGKGNEKDEKRVVAMQVLILEADDKGKENGKCLFIEEVSEAPYEEAHWEKTDGRWMGRGPVENQLENQIARNMTANMRRRSLLWSSKKLFQTSSEEVAKNLIKDVKDGQVMYVGQNGTISPVAMETRNVGEYTSDEDIWSENSKQNSFTFEAATGESMPSGTPFRLGVLLTDAVASFFQLKQEQFGLFLKRSYFEQMIPVFKKDTKEHTVSIFAGEEGVEYYKQTLIEHYINKNIKDTILDGDIPNAELIRAQVEEQVNKMPYFWNEIEDGFYDDAIIHIELEITDEATDTKAEIESLTTLYQSMVQAQDPRAEKVLQQLFARRGSNLDAIAGKKPPAPVQSPMQPQQGQPQLNAPQSNAITA